MSDDPEPYSPRRPERSEGSPGNNSVLNLGDPSLRSGRRRVTKQPSALF